MDTVIDVTVDELCTMDVARIPMKSPTKGFEVIKRSCSATPCPMSLNDSPMSSMLVKKRRRIKHSATTCSTVLRKLVGFEGST
jgi:Tfp pilus assembly protein PilW